MAELKLEWRFVAGRSVEKRSTSPEICLNSGTGRVAIREVKQADQAVRKLSIDKPILLQHDRQECRSDAIVSTC